MLGDTEAGEMRSAAGTVGLALVRVEALPKAGHGFTAGTARLLPQRPGWMVLPDQAP
jgi:hypothetical protein